MKFLKNTIATGLLAASLLALAPQSQAQQMDISPLVTTNGFTLLEVSTNGFTIPATTATNLFITFPDISRYGDVGLWLVSSNNTTQASNNVMAYVSASADGTNWIGGYATLTATNLALAKGAAYTNITLNSLPFLRLDYITNYQNVIITNVTVRLIRKPSRYGS